MPSIENMLKRSQRLQQATSTDRLEERWAELAAAAKADLLDELDAVLVEHPGDLEELTEEQRADLLVFDAMLADAAEEARLQFLKTARAGKRRSL